MRTLSKVSIFIAIIAIFYLAGPKLDIQPVSNGLPALYVTHENVEQVVEELEAGQSIRPDNHARIVWANDSIKKRTPYSILYLHGFSASWYEGHPVHTHVSKEIGANLYLSRLHSHGLETTAPLIDMQPDLLYESAKEALLIARALGEKVIVMGTSTGGTLALMLAVDFPELVESVVLLSPNIFISKMSAVFLTKPWGLEFARNFGGSRGEFRVLEPESENESRYWYMKYRWEAVVYLQGLIETSMNKSLFKQVKQPVFMGYYYKNEEEQDQVVDVPAMLKMFENLGTPHHLKKKVAFPNAGNHVIGCEIMSGSVPEVQAEILSFLKQFNNFE